MFELTYESCSKKGLTSAELDGILETSRSINDKNEVTGCLIHYNRRFIQILEGNQKAVQETFQRISQDKRHKKMRLIAENFSEKRTFPKWGMAYFSVEENAINQIELEQLRRNLKLLAEFSKPVSVASILFWVKVNSLMAEVPGFEI